MQGSFLGVPQVLLALLKLKGNCGTFQDWDAIAGTSTYLKETVH